jgi:hypothetical protein
MNIEFFADYDVNLQQGINILAEGGSFQRCADDTRSVKKLSRTARPKYFTGKESSSTGFNSILYTTDYNIR